MSLALAWQGFRRFEHREVDLNLASAGPLLWMALNGFRSNSQIFDTPFGLPDSWALTHYAQTRHLKAFPPFGNPPGTDKVTR